MESTTNTAVVSGIISSTFTFGHEAYGEKFYTFFLESERLSGTVDTLPVTVSERLISDRFSVGSRVEISGQIRSYNCYGDGRTHLILTLFARSIELTDSEDFQNIVELNGFICKPCVYRTTPFGRQIADILLAVNRGYNKSDYIPCICWGRNAVFASRLNIGDNIKIYGRMQSRKYQKRISDTETIEKTAYEISISRAEILNNDNKDGEI